MTPATSTMAPMPSDPLTLGDLVVPEPRVDPPAKRPKRERIGKKLAKARR